MEWFWKLINRCDCEWTGEHKKDSKIAKKLLVISLVVVLIISVSLNVLAGYQRFLIIPQQTWNDNSFNNNCLTVIRDKRTGVHYLLYRGIRKAGLSVMYDSNGKILIDKNTKAESFD